MTLLFPESIQNVLVTGGAGFIGGAVIRRLLTNTTATIFNLDKMGYSSDLTSIEKTVESNPNLISHHRLLNVDLCNEDATAQAIKQSNPDLVLHLAAETHVDRSIDGPHEFLKSNITGTYNLLQAVRSHWDQLPEERQKQFRFHHVSTDEVFGSLGLNGQFSEATPYAPRSPYSASKAASDHLVKAWHHTYGLPIVLTNCSNNYGPWQFPEKLIPLVILKALTKEPIPLYGDGSNIRDWLFVEDHVEGLLLAATNGEVGQSYCIGGSGERTNRQVVNTICDLLDKLHPSTNSYSRLIKQVADRPGHDRRYAINPKRINTELGWYPCHKFEVGLEKTVRWYLKNLNWCEKLSVKSCYKGERIGLIK